LPQTMLYGELGLVSLLKLHLLSTLSISEG
jgi:hypothetical protein